MPVLIPARKLYHVIKNNFYHAGASLDVSDINFFFVSYKAKFIDGIFVTDICLGVLMSKKIWGDGVTADIVPAFSVYFRVNKRKIRA